MVNERTIQGQRVVPPRQRWRRPFFALVSHPLFTMAIFCVILATFYFLATEYPTNPEKAALYGTDYWAMFGAFV